MRIPAFIDMDLFIINRFSGNTPDSFVDDLLLLDIWFAELKTLVKKKTHQMFAYRDPSSFSKSSALLALSFIINSSFTLSS